MPNFTTPTSVVRAVRLSDPIPAIRSRFDATQLRTLVQVFQKGGRAPAIRYNDGIWDFAAVCDGTAEWLLRADADDGSGSIGDGRSTHRCRPEARVAHTALLAHQVNEPELRAQLFVAAEHQYNRLPP
jgi:hypothetical protein